MNEFGLPAALCGLAQRSAMNNKRNLATLLAIAFVVAILATGLFYGLVVNKLNDDADANRDQIAVAARDLAPGDAITPDAVKWVPRSQVDTLVEGLHSPQEFIGLVVAVPVRQGEAVDRKSLASESSPRGAAVGVPPGLRAVSVHVADSTGVIQLIHPGHRVDAQFVYQDRRGTTSLQTVLQNLTVLRVEPEPEASEGRPVLPVVTLLASPGQADALAVADAVTRIRLVLRHPFDDEITERSSATLAEVLRNPPKPVVQAVSERSDEERSVETAATRGDGSAAVE
jgi:Flp pilus assembly protein CpaB